MFIATVFSIAAATTAETMLASDPRVDWSGRHVVNADGSVTFNWLGVAARVRVNGSQKEGGWSYVTANVTTDAEHRGTRLKAYMSNQDYPLYPEVQFWVNSQTHAPPGVSTTQLLVSGCNDCVVTVENLVGPQYGTGMTTLHSFSSDATFVAPGPRQPTESSPIPDGKTRRIEIIGDSITAATNVVRPPGAPSCGDGGFQSDWSQSYSALLCHRFGADCSTVAVGGKCVMHECGGSQMPDYFLHTFYDESKLYNFSSWAPDAMVIDLGTNDMRAITHLGPVGMARFTNETVQFMKNATLLYNKPDIEFFLTAGPMENASMPGTVAAVEQGIAQGMKVTFINMSTACYDARQHGNSDFCDGCAGHPGIEGHRGMYEAAWPVIGQVMDWN